MGFEDPGEPTTGLPRVAVVPDEAWLLATWTIGKTVLEIGTGLCVSTNAMASTAAFVVTVDPDPWVHETAVVSSNVTLLKELPDAGKFDVAFIDGNHNCDAVAKDIEGCLARLKPGGLLILHDASSGNVQQGAKKAGIEMKIIKTTYGLGLWLA